MNCPCGSQKSYAQCCEPYISGKAVAPTPEALMRSRYSAYVKSETKYLKETLAPESRGDYNEKDVLDWSKTSEWQGLEIIEAKGNTVEFTAKYKTQGKVFEHHEVSTFKKIKDHWYFVDGESHVHEDGKGHGHEHNHEPQKPVVRTEPKLGRNDPCGCGSGKKYKKCCAA
jgi:SEC-C motif-containing protein